MNSNHNHTTDARRPNDDERELDRHIDALRGDTGDGPSPELLAATIRMLDGQAGDDASSTAEFPRFVRTSGSRSIEPTRRFTMTFAQRIYAALSLAAAACVLYFMFVLFNASGPRVAFAQVLEKVTNAKAMAFTTTTEVPGGKQTVVMRTIQDDADHMRIESGNNVTIRSGDVMLILDATNKTATRMDLSGLPKKNGGGGGGGGLLDLNALRALSDKPAEELGAKTIDGVETTGFRIPWNNGGTFTVWADQKAAIPVRVELTIPMGTVTAKAIVDHFDFNPAIDATTFSTEVPEGYALNVQKLDLANAAPDKAAEAVAAFLKLYTSHSGGAFPADLTDWTTNTRVITEGGGTVDPMMTGTLSGQLFSLRDGYHYAGKGARLGEKDKVVFWYRVSKDQPYRGVYGDLRIEQLPADQVPSTQPTTK